MSAASSCSSNRSIHRICRDDGESPSQVWDLTDSQGQHPFWLELESTLSGTDRIVWVSGLQPTEASVGGISYHIRGDGCVVLKSGSTVIWTAQTKSPKGVDTTSSLQPLGWDYRFCVPGVAGEFLCQYRSSSNPTVDEDEESAGSKPLLSPARVITTPAKRTNDDPARFAGFSQLSVEDPSEHDGKNDENDDDEASFSSSQHGDATKPVAAAPAAWTFMSQEPELHAMVQDETQPSFLKPIVEEDHPSDEETQRPMRQAAAPPRRDEKPHPFDEETQRGLEKAVGDTTDTRRSGDMQQASKGGVDIEKTQAENPPTTGQEVVAPSNPTPVALQKHAPLAEEKEQHKKPEEEEDTLTRREESQTTVLSCHAPRLGEGYDSCEDNVAETKSPEAPLGGNESQQSERRLVFESSSSMGKQPKPTLQRANSEASLGNDSSVTADSPGPVMQRSVASTQATATQHSAADQQQQQHATTQSSNRTNTENSDVEDDESSLNDEMVATPTQPSEASHSAAVSSQSAVSPQTSTQPSSGYIENDPDGDSSEEDDEETEAATPTQVSEPATTLRSSSASNRELTSGGVEQDIQPRDEEQASEDDSPGTMTNRNNVAYEYSDEPESEAELPPKESPDDPLLSDEDGDDTHYDMAPTQPSRDQSVSSRTQPSCLDLDAASETQEKKAMSGEDHAVSDEEEDTSSTQPSELYVSQEAQEETPSPTQRSSSLSQRASLDGETRRANSPDETQLQTMSQTQPSTNPFSNELSYYVATQPSELHSPDETQLATTATQSSDNSRFHELSDAPTQQTELPSPDTAQVAATATQLQHPSDHAVPKQGATQPSEHQTPGEMQAVATDTQPNDLPCSSELSDAATPIQPTQPTSSCPGSPQTTGSYRDGSRKQPSEPFRNETTSRTGLDPTQSDEQAEEDTPSNQPTGFLGAGGPTPNKLHVKTQSPSEDSQGIAENSTTQLLSNGTIVEGSEQSTKESQSNSHDAQSVSYSPAEGPPTCLQQGHLLSQEAEPVNRGKSFCPPISGQSVDAGLMPEFSHASHPSAGASSRRPKSPNPTNGSEKSQNNQNSAQEGTGSSTHPNESNSVTADSQCSRIGGPSVSDSKVPTEQTCVPTPQATQASTRSLSKRNHDDTVSGVVETLQEQGDEYEASSSPHRKSAPGAEVETGSQLSSVVPQSMSDIGPLPFHESPKAPTTVETNFGNERTAALAKGSHGESERCDDEADELEVKPSESVAGVTSPPPAHDNTLESTPPNRASMRTTRNSAMRQTRSLRSGKSRDKEEKDLSSKPKSGENDSQSTNGNQRLGKRKREPPATPAARRSTRKRRANELDNVTTKPSQSTVKKSQKRSRRQEDAEASGESPTGTVRILTTGVKLTKQEAAMIINLGGILIEDLDDAHTVTHIIATDGKKQIKRTPKLMIALCRTTNIISLQWLLESSAANSFLPCHQFLVTR